MKWKQVEKPRPRRTVGLGYCAYETVAVLRLLSPGDEGYEERHDEEDSEAGEEDLEGREQEEEP
eukprot:3812668-Rhodomonas_salina.1